MHHSLGLHGPCVTARLVIESPGVVEILALHSVTTIMQ